MSKKLVILAGVGFVVCLVMTIIFYGRMNNQDMEYQEVQVQVVSTGSRTTNIFMRYTSSSTTQYIVEVRYNGEIYDLKNVISLSGYSEGRTVKAYLSNGKMYANVEGVNTSTTVAYIYFGFLFATFILFFIFICNTPRLFQKKE